MNTTAVFRCPSCNTILTLKDVQSVERVALCPGCHQVFELTELMRRDHMKDLLDNPPKSLKVQKTEQGLEIRSYASKRVASWLGMICLIWVSFTVFAMITLELTKLKLLFLTPFIILEFIFLALLVYLYSGQQILTLTPGKGELFMGVSKFGVKYSFPLNTDAKVKRKVSRFYMDKAPLSQVVITQHGHAPVKFGTWIPDTESLIYLVSLVKLMRKPAESTRPPTRKITV